MTESVPIKIGNAPSGDYPSYEKKKPEIKGWLENTSPFYITGTGQTYRDAASKIEQAVAALEEHAPRILEIWKGPDATAARHALSMLHSTGQVLSAKFVEMGGALSQYGTDLSEAQVKVDEEVNAPTSGEGQAVDEIVQEEMEDAHARRTLYELNQQMVSLYNSRIPDELTFDLPKVSIPSGPPDTQDPNDPTGSGNDGPVFSSPVNDDRGGPDSVGSGPLGSPTTNPGGSTPGGSDPGQLNPDGSDPGGANPDGSNPDDSNPGDDPADPDPNNPNDPPAGEDPGQTQDPGSDAVPPVIGGDETTTTDGTGNADPRQTDLATFTPTTPTTATPFTPTTVTPTTFTPTTVTPPTTMNPTGYLTPVGTSPGTPSVIGSPGVLGSQSATGIAGRSIGGATGGMPMMPFMGGAGGGAGEHGDIERTTYLSEDPNAWTSGHDTTDPVIG